MGSPLKWDLPKFKVFNLLSGKHKVFEVSKHKRKIKFDETLGLLKREVSTRNRATKIQTF